MPDPTQLFNASLEGNLRRAIDIVEGQHVNPAAFATLVQQAIAFNLASKAKSAKKAKT